MKKVLLLLSVAVFTLSSCNKKDDIIDSQKDEIANLQYQVEALSKTIKTLNDHLSISRYIIEAKTLEISELTSIINELSADNQEMASVIADLQARVDTLLNDILDLTAVNDDLVSEISTLTDMNDALELNVSSLEGELAYANGLLDDANALISALEIENADLKDELADALAKVVELKNKVRRKNDRIRLLKSKLANAGDNADVLKAEIARLEVELDTAMTDYDKMSQTLSGILTWACNLQGNWVCGKIADIVNDIWDN